MKRKELTKTFIKLKKSLWSPFIYTQIFQRFKGQSVNTVNHRVCLVAEAAKIDYPCRLFVVATFLLPGDQPI